MWLTDRSRIDFNGVKKPEQNVLQLRIGGLMPFETGFENRSQS